MIWPDFSGEDGRFFPGQSIIADRPLTERPARLLAARGHVAVCFSTGLRRYRRRSRGRLLCCELSVWSLSAAVLCGDLIVRVRSEGWRSNGGEVETS